MTSYDEHIPTKDEKLTCATDLMKYVPSGEISNVFSNVRILLNDDTIAQEAAEKSFPTFNKNRFTHCLLPNEKKPCLITTFNELSPGLFFCPRSRKKFEYNHANGTVSKLSDAELAEIIGGDDEKMNNEVEEWRNALEEQFFKYVSDRFGNGAMSVFGSYDINPTLFTLCICIESNRISSKNFWGGTWKSEWRAQFAPDNSQCTIDGVMKVQIHYYEEGNVQLLSHKKCSEEINFKNMEEFVKKFHKLVLQCENDYEDALNANYLKMSETTFRSLRRQLPVTKTKISWANLISYRVGGEILKNNPLSDSSAT
ncbi:hypothetical protein SNEBB_011395 [Seison nebaliae]|nr:hypothetical protein SNEBB_011395 [Seison nebaliae]